MTICLNIAYPFLVGEILLEHAKGNLDQAVEFFLTQGEKYKAEIIASIPKNEPVTIYHEGKFSDLCRGPHVPSTGKLKVFKLIKTQF